MLFLYLDACRAKDLFGYALQLGIMFNFSLKI